MTIWVRLKAPAVERSQELGLVINFGQGRLIDGWERVVNNL